MNFYKPSGFLIALSILSACNNPSSTNFSKIEDAPLPESFFKGTISNMEKNPERSVKGLRNYFNRLAIDDKVAVSKLQVIANSKMAQTRSRILSDFMNLDEDGSGHLSINEVITLSNNQRYNWHEPNSDFISTKEIDKNDDGQLSFYEIYDFAREIALVPNRLTRAPETELNAFNFNHDEFITLNELEEGLSLLSKENFRKSQTKALVVEKNQALNTPPEECIPTLPSKSAKIIFVSGHFGPAIPNISLSRQDSVTHAVKISIEAGKEPLYIVASSLLPNIWSLSGATHRVEKFITSPSTNKDNQHVGVAGLNTSQVEIIGKGCLSVYTRPSTSFGYIAKAKWGTMIDRQPDAMYGNPILYELSLPEGGISTPKTNKPLRHPDISFEKEFRINFENKNPDGILVLKKENVISHDSLEIYQPHPGDAGILQLIDQGAIEVVDRKTYLIVKPFKRFPSTKDGGGNTFILGKEIPMPQNATGYMRVISEKTGDCLYGRGCNNP